MIYHLFHFYNRNNEPQHRNAVERLNYLETDKKIIIYRKHKLPKWAMDDPMVFFQSAVDNSPRKVHTYREMEFGIPYIEASNIEPYVDQIIRRIIPDKYYYVIVEKTFLEKSPLLIHVVFNDGIIDETEKENERPAGQFFWLHRSINPSAGGARKDFYNLLYTAGEQLRKYRKFFVKISNEFFESKGIDYKFYSGIYANSFEDLIILNCTDEEIKLYLENKDN